MRTRDLTFEDTKRDTLLNTPTVPGLGVNRFFITLGEFSPKLLNSTSIVRLVSVVRIDLVSPSSFVIGLFIHD